MCPIHQSYFTCAPQVVRHDDYDRPTKPITVREYLVKWQGQSYAASTWESAEVLTDPEGSFLDVGSKIAHYHAVNDTAPAEPLMTPNEVRLGARAYALLLLFCVLLSLNTLPSMILDNIKCKISRCLAVLLYNFQLTMFRCWFALIVPDPRLSYFPAAHRDHFL